MSACDDSPWPKLPAAAGDEPSGPPGAGPPALSAPAPHPDGRSLFEAALDAGRDVRGGRATRSDGWTPQRIAIFLTTLAETGLVADAAEAAGISRQNAFALRNSAKGRAFALAWDAAVLSAGPSLAETLTLRAIRGWDEPVFRDGKICGLRRRFDNRLGMRLLYRHDRRAASGRRGEAVRLVMDELEQFARIAVGGGEGAAEFVGERLLIDRRGVDEADLLVRADNYARCGAGLACEIDVSDLDPADRANWTPEQAERALRSGLLDELEAEREQDADGDGRRRSGGDPA